MASALSLESNVYITTAVPCQREKGLGITNLLDAVIDAYRRSRSLADAGRALFANFRHQRRTINDSDRLRNISRAFSSAGRPATETDSTANTS
jgi:sigma54-dependent transcription regulator